MTVAYILKLASHFNRFYCIVKITNNFQNHDNLWKHYNVISVKIVLRKELATWGGSTVGYYSKNWVSILEDSLYYENCKLISRLRALKYNYYGNYNFSKDEAPA